MLISPTCWLSSPARAARMIGVVSRSVAKARSVNACMPPPGEGQHELRRDEEDDCRLQDEDQVLGDVHEEFKGRAAAAERPPQDGGDQAPERRVSAPQCAGNVRLEERRVGEEGGCGW